MSYTKIRLPKTELAARSFAELAKKYRVVGVREQGEVVYKVPRTALELLDSLHLPYEIVAGDLPSPAQSSGLR